MHSSGQPGNNISGIAAAVFSFANEMNYVAVHSTDLHTWYDVFGCGVACHLGTATLAKMSSEGNVDHLCRVSDTILNLGQKQRSDMSVCVCVGVGCYLERQPTWFLF